MSFQSINPATGELIKEFPLQSDAEVYAALDKADKRYREDWRLRPVAERAAIVARAARILREKRDEYVTYPTLEMGKVTRFGYMEVDLVADILDYYARNGERLLAAQELPGEPGATLLSEPIGVILAIEPWNFPYYQLARVAAPQLIAGNVVMMKHAENVPQCALAFARLFEEAGAPEGAYTNLFCSVDQIAKLIEDFRVRGVALTGSERAGTSVGERAGRNLKKVILELGGSDPAIIMPGAPLDHAVEQVVMGRTFNSGQGCVNIKRVIVIGRQRGEQMLAALKEKFAAIEIGDPTDESTLLGPLVSERALQGLLKQAPASSMAASGSIARGSISNPRSSPISRRTIRSTRRRPSARCSRSISWRAKRKPSDWPTPPLTGWAAMCSMRTSTTRSGSRPVSIPAWSISTRASPTRPGFPSAASRIPASGANCPKSAWGSS
jgi:succinate-semialdehyde dehydrogenase/glutarate-semialdehyde dehydrogenase